MPPKPATRRPAARKTEQAEGSTSNTPSAQNASTEGGRATPAQSATPAPAGRQPVQRLQSLKKRESSGSISASGRPLSNLPGETAKPVLKYQPKKNVQRRSKEERDAMSKLEQERHNERLKEAAAIQRGRGGARGRGAFRGRGGPVGTGGFGPQGGARRGRGGGAFGPRPYDRSQTRSVFSAGAGSGAAMDDYDSDDDGENGIRISIDQIGLSDDSDSELPQDAKGKLPARSMDPGLRGLKPVRVQRIEHEDRLISVNMESSTARTDELRKKAEQEAKVAQGQEITPEQDDEPRVKAEPVDEDTPMADVLPAEDDEFLPKQKVRVRRKVSDPQSSPVKPKAKAPEPQQVKRDPRELLRTREEIDEYDRHLEDLAHVQELFREEPEKSAESQPAETQQVEPTTEKTPAAEGDSETATEEPKKSEEQETEDQTEDTTAKNLLGQLFLMQFPPMTPNLIIPGSENPEPAPEQAPETAPEATSEANNAQAEVKPEGEGVEITDVDAPPQVETPKLITASTDWSLPAGKVGKLNVHKSGRITMDWGGVSFELDRAAMVDFVQEALIVSSSNDDPDVKKEADEEEENRVWSMGQLREKFTVMPNWDDML